jgi:type IV pilus assembly protein PilW
VNKHSRQCLAGRNRGFTLVELMVSMVLGLVIIGGATGVIIANRQSYRTNEGLSQLQESARSAFELMARDIRQAGVTGCDSNGRVANVVQTASGAEWWQTWFGMEGFAGDTEDGAVVFGTDPRQRIEGTDSLLVQGLDGNAFAIQAHTPSSATFRLNPPANVAANDILMVCNFDHAAIFKVTSYDATSRDMVYASTATGSPRNCSQGLGYPTDCSSTSGNPYQYQTSSQMARLMAVDWFIGNNGRDNGRSLFRQRLGIAQPEEMVAGVSNMALAYLEEGESAFDVESTVTNWSNVVAVRVTLTIDSTDERISTAPGDNQGRLQREFTNVITLRNRVL